MSTELKDSPYIYAQIKRINPDVLPRPVIIQIIQFATRHIVRAFKSAGSPNPDEVAWTTKDLLEKLGQRSEIRTGIRITGKKERYHAWLDVRGIIVDPFKFLVKEDYMLCKSAKKTRSIKPYQRIDVIRMISKSFGW